MNRSTALNAREDRNVRAMARFPWILPVCAGLCLLTALFEAWSRLSGLVDRGAAHGIASFADLERLSELASGTSYDPFQVLAIRTMHEVATNLDRALWISFFLVLMHFQARLTLKLWRARGET
jgi:hypothetical protein